MNLNFNLLSTTHSFPAVLLMCHRWERECNSNKKLSVESALNYLSTLARQTISTKSKNDPFQ